MCVCVPFVLTSCGSCKWLMLFVSSLQWKTCLVMKKRNTTLLRSRWGLLTRRAFDCRKSASTNSSIHASLGKLTLNCNDDGCSWQCNTSASMLLSLVQSSISLFVVWFCQCIHKLICSFVWWKFSNLFMFFQ